MKLHRLIPFVLTLLLGASILTAQAQEATIRKNLTERLKPFPAIDEISKTPMPGLYEVRVNGADLLYTDAEANFLIQGGELVDVRQRRSLTKEREEKLNAIDFAQLPLQDAIKIVRGDGKRKLAVFEDPNCGYCKRFEADLQKINNVTVYLFLYPILGQDSAEKSRNIWCAKDKAKTWQDWMLAHVPPPTAECKADALVRIMEFGRKYRIAGTPAIVFANGQRVPGAIGAERIEALLAASK